MADALSEADPRHATRAVRPSVARRPRPGTARNAWFVAAAERHRHELPLRDSGAALRARTAVPNRACGESTRTSKRVARHDPNERPEGNRSQVRSRSARPDDGWR